uniref:Metallophos domain-containing protein n=1 Tax=Macrostomum lignano TaxID=282301 RepID=A0A1I8IWB6_9PLAT
MPNARQLHILHFNDVYNIEPAGHIGGAARFVTALRSFAELQPLVLFSGDPVDYQHGDPRPASGPVLKACNIDAACFGNHDFDFGVDNLVQCSQETGFPWLLSNIIDRETGRPLAEGLETVCIDHRASGLRIGIVGLVELEWVDTLSTVDPEDIRFFDFCTRGEQLAAKLKSEQSCDLVIALTHMRWPNDRKLARAAHHIDIILGGHDHNYGIEFVNNRAIVKSGTDFRQFSVVSLSIDKSSPLEVKIQTVDVDSSKYSEDPEVAKAV